MMRHIGDNFHAASVHLHLGNGRRFARKGAMRTDLEHLLPAKQRELERVVQIIFEEFDDANNLATGKRKAGRIHKIILYGSYARGGWVDEPHTAKGYKSDYDLLIIVNQKDLTDRVQYWAKADERLMRELAITQTLRTPVNFIVHTLQEVNDGLAHGRYFFMDVASEGIALYQADESELHQPKPKRQRKRWIWRRNILRSGYLARRIFTAAREMQRQSARAS
jgi:predicted nucleotidyltransferase